jgi:hypothetical protein
MKNKPGRTKLTVVSENAVTNPKIRVKSLIIKAKMHCPKNIKTAVG